MAHSEKIIITLDREAEDENTVIRSRKYFDKAMTQGAEPVRPLPGPGLVIPVRAGIRPRALAMVTVSALFCGVLGGWALGFYKRGNPSPAPTVETAIVEANPPSITIPTATTETPLAAPVVAPAYMPPLAAVPPLESRERARKKPVLKPAKTAPKSETQPVATPEGGKQQTPAGESRPRRVSDGNERLAREENNTRSVKERDN